MAAYAPGGMGAALKAGSKVLLSAPAVASTGGCDNGARSASPSEPEPDPSSLSRSPEPSLSRGELGGSGADGGEGGAEALAEAWHAQSHT